MQKECRYGKFALYIHTVSLLRNFTLFLFIRFAPVVSFHEVKHTLAEQLEGAHASP